MEITIKASDGKIYKGSTEAYGKLLSEVKVYEEELKVKREKEEAARKEKEEKQKKIALLREAKLKEINEIFNKAKTMIADYEKETGSKLVYGYDCVNGDMTVREVKNSLDFAWDNIVDDIFKSIKVRKYL